jgi:hypothetical protein
MLFGNIHFVIPLRKLLVFTYETVQSESHVEWDQKHETRREGGQKDAIMVWTTKNKNDRISDFLLRNNIFLFSCLFAKTENN